MTATFSPWERSSSTSTLRNACLRSMKRLRWACASECEIQPVSQDCSAWIDESAILLRYVSRNLPQDKPESFEMLYRGSPSEALQRASEVLSVYWELVTKSDAPVDWRCQHDYTETFGSTTEQSTVYPTQHCTGGNLYHLESSVMSRAAEITDYVSFSTDSYDRNLETASHRRPVKDLYKLGFIIASVCGGLLFILTLYCLITQKVTALQFCRFLNHMCPNKVLPCIPVILQ